MGSGRRRSSQGNRYGKRQARRSHDLRRVRQGPGRVRAHRTMAHPQRAPTQPYSTAAPTLSASPDFGDKPISGDKPILDHPHAGRVLEDTALKDMLFAELKNRNNSPAQFEALLEPLLKAEFAPARDFAASRMTGRRLRNANHRPYAFSAATQLAAHSAGSCWPLLWQQVVGDRQFGQELFLKIAHEYHHESSFYSSLSETQLGDLYIWLEQTFPVREDPHRLERRRFLRRSTGLIAHLRDRILSHLVNRGTEAAIRALLKRLT